MQGGDQESIFLALTEKVTQKTVVEQKISENAPLLTDEALGA